VRGRATRNSFNGDEKKVEQGMDATNEMQEATAEILSKSIAPKDETMAKEAMDFVSTVVLQDRLRSKVESMDAVSFISDGSILPRKSGANEAPMASPPAVPSKAPEDSPLSQTLDIVMGDLRGFLSNLPVDSNQPTVAKIPGMLIPKGITLVAGGGYHGKSTLLRAIASGVYNKIPGDGRETCVTVKDTMSLRAEVRARSEVTPLYFTEFC
jgi:predicted ABC-class ATPase